MVEGGGGVGGEGALGVRTLTFSGWFALAWAVSQYIDSSKGKATLKCYYVLHSHVTA